MSVNLPFCQKFIHPSDIHPDVKAKMIEELENIDSLKRYMGEEIAECLSKHLSEDEIEEFKTDLDWRNCRAVIRFKQSHYYISFNPYTRKDWKVEWDHSDMIKSLTEGWDNTELLDNLNNFSKPEDMNFYFECINKFFPPADK